MAAIDECRAAVLASGKPADVEAEKVKTPRQKEEGGSGSTIAYFGIGALIGAAVATAVLKNLDK